MYLNIDIFIIEENGGNTVMASQLNNIRMKLEEKRRHIENEKRRMEVVVSKQRQEVGKAAFLQAVTKVIINHFFFLYALICILRLHALRVLFTFFISIKRFYMFLIFCNMCIIILYLWIIGHI